MNEHETTISVSTLSCPPSTVLSQLNISIMLYLKQIKCKIMYKAIVKNIIIIIIQSPWLTTTGETGKTENILLHTNQDRCLVFFIPVIWMWIFWHKAFSNETGNLQQFETLEKTFIHKIMEWRIFVLWVRVHAESSVKLNSIIISAIFEFYVY